MFSQRQHQAICSTVSLFNCWQDMKVGFMNTDYFLICGEFEHYTYVIPLPTFSSLGLLWKLLWLGAISFATIFFSHFHKKKILKINTVHVYNMGKCFKWLGVTVPSGSSSLSIASWSLATVKAWSSLSTGLSLTTWSQLKAFGLKHA